MQRRTPTLLALGALTGLSVSQLAGAPAPAGSASPSEYVAVERFLNEIEKPPVAYQARRRLEASSAKLNESAWMEAVTEYQPAVGFSYSIIAQGGSERIQRRVLKSVLDTEKENSTSEEWRKSNLSLANYEFNFGGSVGGGMLRMHLNPRRRDSRLVNGAALLAETSGHLVRVEGRLSKSPSFWVRWANVSRSYAPIGGAMMPVAVDSTADVRIAGLSTFSMTYEYRTINGQPVTAAENILSAR
jgi:hypothetical protein